MPLFDNSGNKINKKEYDPYLKGMNKRFGGNSSWRTGGCFIDKGGREQCEGNVVITSFRDFENPFDNRTNLDFNKRVKTLQKDEVFVDKLARQARKRFGQEGVSYIHDKIAEATIVEGIKKPKIPKSHTTKKFEPFREIF